MKPINITLIILVAASILVFVRSGMVFHIAKSLPFCSGNPIEWGYDLGGLAMIVIFLWGLNRLRRNQGRDD
jgi:hypothetical protein